MTDECFFLKKYQTHHIFYISCFLCVFFFLTMFLRYISVDKGGPDLLILTSLHSLLFDEAPCNCVTQILLFAVSYLFV